MTSSPVTSTVPRPGATVLDDARTVFRVWAPASRGVEVVLVGEPERRVPLERVERGSFEGVTDLAPPGTLYRFQLDDGTQLPDPASLSQPLGVHGPSRVTSLSYPWSDLGWSNPPLEDHVLYEMHVGAFTPEGTFESARGRLDHLVRLGVTAVEVMPVAQFPGVRNWGYDGVYPYAVQHSYGGPEGFQRFVDDCHDRGLSVVLDVVYNHLGPEGNYLHGYAPYFTDAYRTPWGSAINLDRSGSDEVRRYLVENALMWVTDFHVDALRLDAVHALFDRTARPFLAQLAEEVHGRAEELGRRVQLVAESPLNDPRLVRSDERGGLGLDAVWNEDFHHALHVATTGERSGYYLDFADDPVGDLAKAMVEGFANDGRYSPAAGHTVGAPSADLPRSSLVVYDQNHDQVGNRPLGDRLTRLVPEERARLALAACLLSPSVPLLFMGEEWGETNPFLFFVDHGDPDLVEAVREGRAREFADFFRHHPGEVPDPASPEVFERSRLDWDKPAASPFRERLALARELLSARRRLRSLRHPEPASHGVEREGALVRLLGDGDRPRTLAWFNLGDEEATGTAPDGSWERVLDGMEERLGGSGKVSPSRVTGGEAVALPGWGFLLFQDGQPAGPG